MVEKTKKTPLVPDLMFNEFNSDGTEVNYKKYLFNDIFLFGMGKNIKQAEASPEFEIPCVRYGELYHMYGEVIDKVINRTNLDISELVFSKGDEILLPSAGEDPLDIGSASALTLENIAIGRTINILRPKKANLYNQVYASYFINEKLKKKIAALAQGVSISNVYNSGLKKLHIVLPSLPEQKKIAAFLSAVDEKIRLLQRKRALLEHYKKGLMQQLFPSTGSGQAPELRFKQEDGSDFPDWERKELGDLLDYEQPTKYIVDSTEYNDLYSLPVLTAGKTFVLGYTDEKNGVFEANLPVIIFDDFTTAFKFVDFKFKVKSSAMKILISKDDVNSMSFIFNAMSQIKFPLGEHKRYWISEYQYMKIHWPCEAEQQKIASFLSAMDEKIGLVGQQVAQMQAFKKGLLQQMFV